MNQATTILTCSGIFIHHENESKPTDDCGNEPSQKGQRLNYALLEHTNAVPRGHIRPTKETQSQNDKDAP